MVAPAYGRSRARLGLRQVRTSSFLARRSPRVTPGRVGALVGVVTLMLGLSTSVSGASALPGATNGPGPATALHSYLFVNLSSTIRGEASAPRTSWTGASAVAVRGGNASFATVGRQGSSIYPGLSGSAGGSLPSAALDTVAFGDGRFLLAGTGATNAPLYEVFPRSGRVVNLTSWFGNASGHVPAIFSVTWRAPEFLLFGGTASALGGYSGRLLSFAPATMTVRRTSSLLPAQFRSLGSCCGEDALIASPGGVILSVWSTAGRTLGELFWNGTFVDLSGRIDPYFEACDGGGTPTLFWACQAAASSDLAFDGHSVWLVGLDRVSLAPRLYRIDPSNATVTNESARVTGPGVHPDTIACSGGRVYLAGYLVTNVSSPSYRPLLWSLDPATGAVQNLSRYLPTGFFAVASIAGAGRTLYLTGGPWTSVDYALLVPV